MFAPAALTHRRAVSKPGPVPSAAQYRVNDCADAPRHLSQPHGKVGFHLKVPPFALLALFIIVPLVELVLLIQLGSHIGVLATIAIVIITAIVGTSLLRQQGFGVLARASEAMNAGRVPIESVGEGICLLIAGAFLLTPGLLTDAVGFALLVPPVRARIARWGLQRIMKSGLFSVHVYRGEEHYGRAGPQHEEPSPFGPGADTAEDMGQPYRPGRGRQKNKRHSGPGPIIEGEYEDLDKDDDPRGTGPRR